MKILQVNNYNYLRGGSERYFLDVSELLSEAGHEIVKFHASSERDLDCSWSGELPKVIDTNGKNYFNALSGIYRVSAGAAFGRVLDDFSPDIIHLHIYYGQLTSSILHEIQKRNIPTVQTLHEYKLLCPVHSLIRNGNYCDDCKGSAFWKAAYYRCNRGSFVRSAFSSIESYISKLVGSHSVPDTFICVSNYQKNLIISSGIDQSKVIAIPHFNKGINRSQGHAKHILYVGRLADGKGVDSVIRAYSSLTGLQVPLHIVGDGPQRQYLIDLAANLGCLSSINFLGHLEGSELARQYKDSIFAVNFSQLNETFGLTVLEAMSYGKPVIVSDKGALPELVVDTFNGFVCPTVGSLQNAMLKILEDDELRVEMGRMSIENCIAKYSPSAHLTSLLGVYQSVYEKSL